MGERVGGRAEGPVYGAVDLVWGLCIKLRGGGVRGEGMKRGWGLEGGGHLATP